MIKKTVIFFVALIVSGAYADAFAVPSVRQLGTTNVSANTTANTEKTVSVLPSLPKANHEVVRATKTQTDNSARISVAGAVKTISSARIKQPGSSTSSGGSSSQPGTSGVSDAAFNEIVGRVQTLEAKSNNAITGVTGSGSGNYVTGVAVGSDNKLEVTKSRVLVAPVFQGNTDTGGNAEIWVVK